MNILSLDLGTKTGWAFRGASGELLSGMKPFTPTRFEGGGMRYFKFNAWLTDVFAGMMTPDYVVFEEVRRHLSTDSAHAYGGFLATLAMWCELRKIPYQGVPVGTIKKFATGSGSADKETMIFSALTWGCDPEDDNEADAFCLLYWAMKERRLKQPKPRRMAKQIKSRRMAKP